MIKIENLYKTYNYKKSNAFEALSDINLTVNDGEFVAVVGKSGAGKSTLLHILGCIDTFEKGHCYIDDIDTTKMSDGQLAKIRNKKIGIVMQDFALVDDFSVRQNVQIPLRFSGIKGKRAKKMADEALDSVGILSLSEKLCSQLSGGQKQRVAIARAIVNNPSFILADEPTGALDSKTSLEIMNVFKELNNQGKTIIIITHDSNVADMCKRQITISDGKIV